MSLSAKETQVLKLAASRNWAYPGIRQDLIPEKSATKLKNMGLIEAYIPNNPVHKDRWAITEAGRIALTEAEGISS